MRIKEEEETLERKQSIVEEKEQIDRELQEEQRQWEASKVIERNKERQRAVEEWGQNKGTIWIKGAKPRRGSRRKEKKGAARGGRRSNWRRRQKVGALPKVGSSSCHPH